MKNTIKLEDVHYYENAANVFQKAFVAVQSNCALCASNLEISVNPQDDGQVHEEAFCPQCEIRMRSKNHVLQ